MRAIRKTTFAAAASLLLLFGACGDDDASDSSGGAAVDQNDTSDPDDASSGNDDSSPAPSGGQGGGTATFGGEEVTIESMRCFFEEQPRAGLGGVFTHSAQAAGVNAAGEAVVIDMSRSRAEDGEVADDVSFDVGDPFGDEFVGYSHIGPEGDIAFGDDGASATDLEMRNLEEFDDFVLLSFDLTC